MSSAGLIRGTGRITNRTMASGGSCGGNKKAGLKPTVGVPINILANKNYSPSGPLCCKSQTCERMSLTRNRAVQNLRAQNNL